ncbi:MAG: hypothetical protein R6U13_13505 [Desulfatiglandaceae bacterium]
MDYLKERNLLEKSLRKQKQEGDEALWKALKSPLKAEKLVQVFAKAASLEEAIKTGKRVQIR